jgi:hypothetical protein
VPSIWKAKLIVPEANISMALLACAAANLQNCD